MNPSETLPPFSCLSTSIHAPPVSKRSKYPFGSGPSTSGSTATSACRQNASELGAPLWTTAISKSPTNTSSIAFPPPIDHHASASSARSSSSRPSPTSTGRGPHRRVTGPDTLTPDSERATEDVPRRQTWPKRKLSSRPTTTSPSPASQLTSPDQNLRFEASHEKTFSEISTADQKPPIRTSDVDTESGGASLNPDVYRSFPAYNDPGKEIAT
jgi:hypothetical protein